MLLALSNVTYVLIGWFKFLLLKFLYEYGAWYINEKPQLVCLIVPWFPRSSPCVPPPVTYIIWPFRCINEKPQLVCLIVPWFPRSSPCAPRPVTSCSRPPWVVGIAGQGPRVCRTCPSTHTTWPCCSSPSGHRMVSQPAPKADITNYDLLYKIVCVFQKADPT